MTYELAQQLKDAGFPQPDFEHDCGESSLAYGKEGKLLRGDDKCSYWPGKPVYYFPTLSELIEACGDNFGALIKDTIGYYALTPEGLKLHIMIESRQGLPAFIDPTLYDTPKEAVARVWLLLNSK
jgi:hypothetical protein